MLVGIIWLIQLVHYPAFMQVDKEKWMEFHRNHTTYITPIVAPLMCAELGLTVYSLYQGVSFMGWIQLALVLVIWASTFGMQVPLHQKLAEGYEPRYIKRLVSTNWVRTFAWTIKLASMMIWM